MITPEERRRLDGASGSPIRRLYLFDDLTAHVERIAPACGLEAERLADVVSTIRETLLTVMACVDRRHQTVMVVDWEHACAQLSFYLGTQGRAYDVVISQGANGQYGADDLDRRHRERYGGRVLGRHANVRVTHFYEERADPFYSDITLGVSRGRPLDEQCREAAAAATDTFGGGSEPVRIAVFDECIATGHSTETVADAVAAAIGEDVPHELEVLAFVGSEGSLRRLAGRGWTTWAGVVLPGAFMPVEWDVDLHLVRDQVLTDALRFADGTTQAPFEAEGWYERIFVADPRRAADAFRELRAFLGAEGLLDSLEAL